MVLVIQPGKVFGDLTVIEGEVKNDCYPCRCICGKEIRVYVKTILRQKIKDCGCKNRFIRKKNKYHFKPGDIFGKLTLVEEAIINRGGITRWGWIARCECGNFTEGFNSDLFSGNKSSCGCSQGFRSHGMSKEPIYHVWQAMKDRCNNPNNKDYRRYGERGIKISPLFNTFEGFLENIPAGYSKGLELDRIDNSKGYFPDNLRWVTDKVNANNREKAVRLKDPFLGDEVSLETLSLRYSIKINTIRNRMSRSQDDLKSILTRPIKRERKFPEEDILEIKKLVKEGKSNKQILSLYPQYSLFFLNKIKTYKR